MFVWATLPEDIDTTNLLAQCEGWRWSPGRAAYVDVDELRGASSMRLNFAGLPEAEIREGVRRIGAAVDRQMRLFGALTGSPRPRSTPPSGGGAAAHAGARGPEQAKEERRATQADEECRLSHPGKEPQPTEERRTTQPAVEPPEADGLADVVQLRRRRASGR